MKTLGKPELFENRTIRPVPRPSGLQRVYCIVNLILDRQVSSYQCIHWVYFLPLCTGRSKRKRTSQLFEDSSVSGNEGNEDDSNTSSTDHKRVPQG
ncbi:hypothetical protein DPMN_059118 [Dreissena polymorpha]|uniref:Uncharacterized protein n=1 Tax=Dreissena polymorpha TaxID=45954 RepID=A0A9D4C2Z5_DREPO|nr:hypothetical protein DPMN_059118 [Dreissena polymorpha]